MDKNDELNDVLGQLSLLEPTGQDVKPSAQQALYKLKQATHTPVPRRNIMNKRIASIAVFAILLAGIFALPSTRALASEFLGLFRVQKFAPISVSPQQLAKLEDLADTGLFPGEVTMISEPTEPLEFASFEDAQTYMSQTDTPTWTSTLYTLGEPNYVAVKGSGEAEMVINLEGARAIMEAVDADPSLLPDSLDGATIDMNINDVLIQDWETVTLVQTLGPEIGYPEDVDPAVIGEAILQFLGMDDDEAYRLSRNIDWTNTMVLPVPSDLGTFSEVSVGSTTGLAIESLEGDGATLMWQEFGMVNVLRGMGEFSSTDALVDLAETGGFR